MKIKTSELQGAALDWAVGKCSGWDNWDDGAFFSHEGVHAALFLNSFKPSTDWSDGGPIIERERITVGPVFHAERAEGGAEIHRQDGWAAHVTPKAYWTRPKVYYSPTPLVGAMRAYVASVMGNEVEVPDNLTTGD